MFKIPRADKYNLGLHRGLISVVAASRAMRYNLVIVGMSYRAPTAGRLPLPPDNIGCPMANQTQGDDGVRITPTPSLDEPDAHGQAALLFAESILHTLVEARVLTSAQAVACLRTAAEVKVEVAKMIGESRANMERSVDLLGRIGDSFAADGKADADR